MEKNAFSFSTGVWTQGLTLARQVLLLLEPLTSPAPIFKVKHSKMVHGLKEKTQEQMNHLSHVLFLVIYKPVTINYFFLFYFLWTLKWKIL
jgi:hypothetical protein